MSLKRKRNNHLETILVQISIYLHRILQKYHLLNNLVTVKKNCRSLEVCINIGRKKILFKICHEKKSKYLKI